MPSADAVLIIAFGGPTCLEEVPAFVTNVLGGRQLPAERMTEIVERYRLIGGRSPLNEIVFRQARELAEWLRGAGLPLPVYVGMRDWSPSLTDTLQRMGEEGIRQVIGLILAPHQAEASWGRYQAAVAAAQAQIGALAPQVAYTSAWFDHPAFVEAMADRLRQAIAQISADRWGAARVLFTAHSIPVAMAERSPYARQVARSAELAAAALGDVSWSVAYQSRSQFATQPWLEPDLYDVIRAEAARGVCDIIVAPIGFVFDHLEVLYDLDVVARSIASEAGVHLARVATVADHPAFIRMMGELVADVKRGG